MALRSRRSKASRVTASRHRRGSAIIAELIVDAAPGRARDAALEVIGEPRRRPHPFGEQAAVVEMLDPDGTEARAERERAGEPLGVAGAEEAPQAARIGDRIGVDARERPDVARSVVTRER